MLVTRQDQERREEQQLAPYAVRSARSLGRRHPEPEHDLRSRFQRDRDRIVHSTAFRRLEYKTQVFVNHEGDHYRTRLTHTMEVAQISRTIARVLGLNEDLVEALALAHDIGHTPFGHAGERVLDRLLRGQGEAVGFEHNAHGLRVADVLEKRYPQFEGLNLSYEVREGFVLHNTAHDRPGRPAAGGEFDHMPSLEVQVVSAADEIAYYSHDLDDGLESRLIAADNLEDLALWRMAGRRVGGGLDGKMHRAAVVRELINLQVQDLVSSAQAAIQEMRLESLDAVRSAPRAAVTFSADFLPVKNEFQAALMERLYRHHRVMRMTGKAERFLEEMFTEFIKRDGDTMPPAERKRIAADGLPRVAADYIAGMTDRYAQETYKQLFHPFEKT
ncbi:MAG TPA: deoxyguanosinetriphosphate triphosphohydrolase [Planctomycetota bacterium]|nr:deoxyguanosinetriphosphate triphosphohydrolase [Planctomycetota bacterium]